MLMFLTVWPVAALALSAAVIVLWLVFRLLDSDLGVEGVWRETIIVLVTAALHAGFLVVITMLPAPWSGYTTRATAIFVFLSTSFIYAATHPGEMELLESSGLAVVNIAMLMLAYFILAGLQGLP